MQTHFSLEQLADPNTAEAEKILRACVHCGFCTATCPTFVLLGDELDSPRGRIYLVKEMLENARPADRETVLHIDRCLSCLACMTTCPSGVDYMHLVDTARAHIEKTYRRPWLDRLLRRSLGLILPVPSRFRLALKAAALAQPAALLLAGRGEVGSRLATMLRLVPRSLPPRSVFARRGTISPQGRAIARVALVRGCAQTVLRPQINDAAIRLLTRLGVEIVQVRGETCCGALGHHLGEANQAVAAAQRNIDAWWAEIEERGLDAIVITASGCGTMIKDYGHLLRNDDTYAEKARRISALAKDVTEFVVTLALPTPRRVEPLTIAYQSACSMQHGQKLDTLPKMLLARAGFIVRDVPEGHLCCGSAGTYNILQPQLATRLRDRKIENIRNTAPNIVATGNIGCLTQLADALEVPIVHTVELLDFAYGGEHLPEFDRSTKPTRSHSAAA